MLILDPARLSNFVKKTTLPVYYALPFYLACESMQHRDVSAGTTGATAVAPKFSNTLTLLQPWGADSAHHWRCRT